MKNIKELATSIGVKPKKVKRLLNEAWNNAYDTYSYMWGEMTSDPRIADAPAGYLAGGEINPEWEAYMEPIWEEYGILSKDEEAFLLGDHHLDGGARWNGDSLGMLRWLLTWR